LSGTATGEDSVGSGNPSAEKNFPTPPLFDCLQYWYTKTEEKAWPGHEELKQDPEKR